MKLKNSALQELYYTIFGVAVTFTVDKKSPIDKAFRECDEKLSGSATFAHIKTLQERNDILEESDKALLEANMKLAGEHRKLEKEIERLHKEIELMSADGRTAFSANKKLEKDLDYGVAICTPEDYRKDGMYEVWRKLREVADATSSELLGCFADVCELEDLIEWDLEDFMDEYKVWQEKKELNHMRDYLVDFCKHRSCFGCGH